MNDIVFAIDPGSVRTGWAVLSPPQELVEAGLLLPDKRAAGCEFRINTMCQDLWQLLDKHRPKTILLEWVSGKINPRRHKSQGQGLQVHGAATGSLWRECLAWRRSLEVEQAIQIKIVLILENTWTRGVNKKDRQIAIADLFPAYRIEQDSGADIADAIGLGIWYCRRQMVKLAEALP